MNGKTIQSLQQALTQLRAERDQLNVSIAALEQLVAGLSRSPGRKKSVTKVSASTRRPGRKPKWSAAARQAAAVRMRRYWASRRKAA